MKPQLERLTKGFARFGIVASVAMIKLIEASPRLRAQLEILNLRFNQLLRIFFDELAPIIKVISELVRGLTQWFEKLPPRIQEAVKVGFLAVAMLGLLSIAFISLQAAMSPIVLIVLGIVAAVALLYLAWDANFLQIQDVTAVVVAVVVPLLNQLAQLITNIADIVLWTVDIIGPALELLEAVFTEVLKIIAALFLVLVSSITDAVELINIILTTDFIGILNSTLEAVDSIITDIQAFFDLLPFIVIEAIKLLIADLGDFGDLLDESLITPMEDIADLAATAGADIATAFVDGIVDGIAAGIVDIEAALDDVAGLFGGSLPERGPLKNIVHMGQEVGETYVSNIGVGLERGKAGDIFTRTFNIEKIEMTVPEATIEKKKSFLERLDSDVRRATTI